jgi:hypothetical protein
METSNFENLIEKSYSIFQSGNEDRLDEIFAKDVKEHTPDLNIPSDKKGIEYFKEQMRIYYRSFPDCTFDIKEIFVKGDKAISYVTIKGKNTGDYNGMPPTNKEIIMDMCEMFKFKNGKISEHWQIMDNMSFMLQLGLLTEQDLQKKMEHF